MFAAIRQLQELDISYVEAYGQGDFDGQNSGHDFFGVSFPLRLCCSRWDGSDVRRGARTTEGARGGGDESARGATQQRQAGRNTRRNTRPPAVREECSRTGEQPLARARPVCSSMRRRRAGKGGRARDGRETAALTTLRCAAS